MSREQLQAIYDERVRPVVIELQSGDVVENPSFNPATYDMDKAADSPDGGRPAPQNLSSISACPIKPSSITSSTSPAPWR